MSDTFKQNHFMSDLNENSKNRDTNYDTNYTKNPSEKIIFLLKEKEILRERDLIKLLSPKDKPKTQKISIPTIKRTIRVLEKQGILIKIRKEQFKEYALNEKDKGAVYLSLKEDENELRLMKKVIELLDTADKFKQKIALEELKGKINIRLKQPQIDKLVSVLVNESSTWNDVLYQTTLRILSQSILRGVIPSIDNFGKLTNFLYTKYLSLNLKELQNTKQNLASNLIKLLGLLEDKRLIDILKDQIKKNVLGQYYTSFNDWTVSKTIIKYDLELFDLQIANKKNEAIVFLIKGIRTDCQRAYDEYKGNLARSENAIRWLSK